MLVQKICRSNKKKRKAKSVIQKAKLVLPRKLQYNKNDSSFVVEENQTKSNTDNNDDCSCMHKKEVTCGTQFLHQQNITTCSNPIDSNPEELASGWTTLRLFYLMQ